MRNGMVKDNFKYTIIEGITDDITFESPGQLYLELFEDADLSFFKTRFEDHNDLISILAYENH